MESCEIRFEESIFVIVNVRFSGKKVDSTNASACLRRNITRKMYRMTRYKIQIFFQFILEKGSILSDIVLYGMSLRIITRELNLWYNIFMV